MKQIVKEAQQVLSVLDHQDVQSTNGGTTFANNLKQSLGFGTLVLRGAASAAGEPVTEMPVL